MAAYSTKKSTPQGKAQTIERRTIRAAKQGSIRTKRNGK